MGYRVFPCAPLSKLPITPHGYKDATTDLAQILDWWHERPQANIGLATGKGILVADLDIPKNWTRTVLNPPRCITPNSGFHLYFQVNGRCPTTAGKIGPGIDTRGDGGYVIVPPSRLSNGRYEWIEDLDGNIPLLPTEIATRLTEKHYTILPGDTTRNGHAELSYALGRLVLSSPGTRNDTLFRCALRIGGMVQSGILDRDYAFQSLTNTAVLIGLTSLEVSRTIESGFRRGGIY